MFVSVCFMTIMMMMMTLDDTANGFFLPLTTTTTTRLPFQKHYDGISSHYSNGRQRQHEQQSITTTTVQQKKTTQLMMIQLPSFGSTASSSYVFPKDIKDAVSKCRQAVQSALKNKQSRMLVEMPVGTKFGVEAQKSSGRLNRLEENQQSQELLETSDRELARIFVEMFQPLGEDHISVVFTQHDLAREAQKAWGNDEFPSGCYLFSMTAPNKKQQRKQNKKKKKGEKKYRGFAAKFQADLDEDDQDDYNYNNKGIIRKFDHQKLPPQTELVLFVSPNPRDFEEIERLCQTVGMGTLVILLNARVVSMEQYRPENDDSFFVTPQAKQLFMEEFDPVFFLGAAPQNVAPGCLVHRAFPKQWMIARKPKVGQPKVLQTLEQRPQLSDCQQAYESQDVSELEKGVENVLGNVATWLR